MDLFDLKQHPFRKERKPKISLCISFVKIRVTKADKSIPHPRETGQNTDLTPRANLDL